MDSLRKTVEHALGNQYEVLQLIGRGGMGAVYLARERFLERLVAVKVLPHDTATDASDSAIATDSIGERRAIQPAKRGLSPGCHLALARRAGSIPSIHRSP